MKTMKVMNSILLAGLLLIGAADVQAVDYKSTYKGQGRSYQQTEYQVAQTATAPAVGFQSTSVYSPQSSTQTTLNADGTVNAEAYGVGQEGSAQAPGRGAIRRNPNNPVVGDDDEGNVPLGDAAIPLALFACMYVLARAFLKKRALKS